MTKCLIIKLSLVHHAAGHVLYSAVTQQDFVDYHNASLQQQ